MTRLFVIIALAFLAFSTIGLAGCDTFVPTSYIEGEWFSTGFIDYAVTYAEVQPINVIDLLVVDFDGTILGSGQYALVDRTQVSAEVWDNSDQVATIYLIGPVLIWEWSDGTEAYFRRF